MTEPRAATCWAISDGAAGNERQATALAEAMALVPRVVRIRVAQPWRALSPRLTFGSAAAIRDENGAVLSAPWPDIAIGCGRLAALATRSVRQRSSGRTFAVQILDPRIDSDAFDLVISPQHDRVRGANVLRTIGALNPVDASWLARGRAEFTQLGARPAPRTAVLIGASHRAQRLDATYFDALLERLGAWHSADAGSYLVTVSRRTPRALAERLRAAFQHWPGVFWSGAADGPNPYAAFLAWADRIFVTPDSVNMISEACATGKAVYTFAPRAIGGKLAAFHAELRASGHLRLLDDTSHREMPPPLAETAAIAELVRARWLAHAKARAAI